MSIMATMFVKLVYFQCSVYWSKRFFCCFCNIVTLRKRKSEHFHSNEGQKSFQLPAQCATTLHSLRIAAILLVNARKSLKFHCFESVQKLVFFYLKFILFRLFLILFFVVEAGIVLNLFLNFEPKLASYSYEIVL